MYQLISIYADYAKTKIWKDKDKQNKGIIINNLLELTNGKRHSAIAFPIELWMHAGGC